MRRKKQAVKQSGSCVRVNGRMLCPRCDKWGLVHRIGNTAYCGGCCPECSTDGSQVEAIPPPVHLTC